MLYVDAIRVLEKVARARFDLASMPKKEEIEEAIPIVAGILPFVFRFVDRPGGVPGEWDRVAFRGAARQGIRRGQRSVFRDPSSVCRHTSTE